MLNLLTNKPFRGKRVTTRSVRGRRGQAPDRVSARRRWRLAPVWRIVRRDQTAASRI